MKNHKTNITFSTDAEIIDELKQKALEKNLTTNKLVENILRHYVNWQHYTSLVGNIPLHASIIKEVFSTLTERQLSDIAQTFIENYYLGMVTLMHGDCKLESMIKALEGWLQSSSQRFIIKDYDGKKIFIIHHEIGKNWSIFVKACLDHAFKEFENCTACAITDSSIKLVVNLDSKKMHAEEFEPLPFIKKLLVD